MLWASLRHKNEFVIVGATRQLRQSIHFFVIPAKQVVDLRELESRAYSMVSAASLLGDNLESSPWGGGCEATGGGFARMWGVGGGMWTGYATTTVVGLMHCPQPLPRPFPVYFAATQPWRHGAAWAPARGRYAPLAGDTSNFSFSQITTYPRTRRRSRRDPGSMLYEMSRFCCC